MGFKGKKHHLKRINAPHHWMLDKLTGTWAYLFPSQFPSPRPSSGPHALRECLPLILILRNRLKYALTRNEVLKIVMGRMVKVDGKVRTDMNFPAGLMDVVELEKTNERFRLVLDVKGRFSLVRINKDSAAHKILRVKRKDIASKGVYGVNPVKDMTKRSVPYIATHDGRVLRFPNPAINVGDSIKYDLNNNSIVGHYPLKVGVLVLITGGKNKGRVGTLSKVEKHVGSFTVAQVTDAKNNSFSTRMDNIFVIGEKEGEALIKLPHGAGLRRSRIQDRHAFLKRSELTRKSKLQPKKAFLKERAAQKKNEEAES